MNTHGSNGPKEPADDRSKLLLMYGLAALSAAVVLFSMIDTLVVGMRMTARHAPQLDAVLEIKLATTRAHLWLEEVVSGDKTRDIAEVWSLLDGADWYMQTLLEGGENEEGKLPALKDEQLRGSVRQIQEQLAEFRRITRLRHETPAESGIGSEIGQEYNGIYNQLISEADAMQTVFQNKITGDLDRFRAVQVALILLAAGLFITVAIIFDFFIRRHMRDEKQLHAANQQLQASEQQLHAANQQLQASEQQLKASNQQLLAGEQQLRAANQQLRASEQQLKGSNQQLVAGEQQLRAANQQLATREKEYLLLFNEMTSGLAVHEIICDDKGNPCDYRFLDINPAFERLTGMKRQDVVGNTIRRIMPTIDTFWIDTYGKVALTGEPVHFEHYNKELVKHFDVAAYMPRHGQFAVIFNDVTERKHAQMELERLNKSLSIKNKELQSIIYAASHDLRSPLVNIQGFSGELNRSCRDLRRLLETRHISDELRQDMISLVSQDIPEALEFISAGTEKMKTLLAGLLQVSRVGSVDIDVKALDMNELLASVIAATQFQIDDMKATVTLEDLPPCLGDADQINQVFSNLVSNALQYSSPDRAAEVRISGRVSDDSVVYCVEDNGLGIQDNHKENIFEIFHRLNPKNSPDGEGLGLTIVSRILDRHEGRVWVESKPGAGSRFFVSLPRA